MPNLENLKKRAKLIQRWHREGYYPVAAQIRAVLPRFRHMSDGEILMQSFRLSDAQEMVARKSGFELAGAQIRDRHHAPAEQARLRQG
jgi:hypothetical protein